MILLYLTTLRSINVVNSHHIRLLFVKSFGLHPGWVTPNACFLLSQTDTVLMDITKPWSAVQGEYIVEEDGANRATNGNNYSWITRLALNLCRRRSDASRPNAEQCCTHNGSRSIVNWSRALPYQKLQLGEPRFCSSGRIIIYCIGQCAISTCKCN